MTATGHRPGSHPVLRRASTMDRVRDSATGPLPAQQATFASALTAGIERVAIDVAELYADRAPEGPAARHRPRVPAACSLQGGSSLMTIPQQTSADLADEQPAFILSDDVEAVARKVIADHEASFGWLLDYFRVAFLLKLGDKPDPDDEIDTVAKCVKAPALWSVLAGYDFAIWVKDCYWNVYPATMREALLAHELSHIGMTDAGKPKVLPHTVEEFSQIAAWYGPWSPNLAHLGKNLVGFLRDGADLAERIVQATADQYAAEGHKVTRDADGTPTITVDIDKARERRGRRT